MKKLMLSVLVVGAMLATSCKKGKAEAKKALDTVEAEAGTVANSGTEVAGDAVNNGTDAAQDLTTKEGEVAEGAATAVENVAESVKEAGVEAAVKAIEAISVPDFGNEKVNTYAKAFLDYAKSYIANKGDVMKDGLAKKGQELAAQQAGVSGDLDDAGKTKLAEFMTKVQEIMTSVTSK